MASVKIVLRKKKNKDGTYPLAIRITKDRNSSFIHIGHHILQNQWDAKAQQVKKSHPNSTRLNNLILKKLSEGNDKLLELEIQKNDISSRSIKKGLKPKTGLTFFAQADLFLSNLKQSGKYNRVTTDQPRIDRFREFLKGEDISFQEITTNLLNKYKAFLISTRNIKERTIINHLILIRTIYNQAIKEQIVDAKHYPFGKDKVQIKFPESIKIGLDSEELKKLENFDLTTQNKLNHYRNLWLFSYYFAGMRVSDVLRLRWSDFQKDRLVYRMGKNSKPLSLKANEKALSILAQYKNVKKSKDDVIFPELKGIDLDETYEVQRKISYSVKTIDKYLRQIAKLMKLDKKFSCIFRVHFWKHLGDKISIQMLQKLYRHSSVTTTIGYQASFMHRDADDALEAVLGL